MLLANEGHFYTQSNFKLKPPISSYEITSDIPKNSTNIYKVDFKPTNPIFYNKDLIPNWIDVLLYSISRKQGKRINALYIVNKCLTSNNPLLLESTAILYCHDNETDLLRILPFLIDISIQLKCDIISFDYLGFGPSKEKVKNNSILIDGEEIINFSITYLNYKIENLILMGKGIGCMTAVHLANLNEYHYCKALILSMPIIGSNTIDIEIMRSIICKTLLIKEVDEKDDIEDDDIINLCREIPNEKEWFPKKKKNSENKFIGFNKFIEQKNNKKDVYYNHRKKFILKLRDYIYPEEEIIKAPKKTSSSGESTQLETNSNLSLANKNNDFDDVNDNKKNGNMEEKEIKINNNEDY